jgi:hypothetical protein
MAFVVLKRTDSEVRDGVRVGELVGDSVGVTGAGVIGWGVGPVVGGTVGVAGSAVGFTGA